MHDDTQIVAVPTNIITGFLGVGKTSAILHLLKHKPDSERWAVLVNEFGEIGVDGSLFQGQQSEDNGVFIREVPGGCMCCAAGLPMQIALNQLLARARPDRLLIEPTGLGHPIEVLQALSAEHYRDTLSIQRILTLVDARKLVDSRYTDHTTFNQQIAIADVIVGNKQDLYHEGDEERLEAYGQAQGVPGVQVLFTRQGIIDPKWLAGATAATSEPHHQHHDHGDSESSESLPIPGNGYLTATNQGEGFESIGWRFAANRVFNRDKLIAFLRQLQVERMKAVIITDDGIFGYNLTADGLTEGELEDSMESRVEIIAPAIDATWETQLLACLSRQE